MYRFKKNDLFGIVSYAGDVIMEPNFEEIYGFANKIGTGETKDGSLCIIDSDKVKILKHDSIEYLEGFYCERAAVDDENYNTGFINTEGELVIEQLYNRAHNFFDGVSTLMKNGLYGAIDILGNTILDFKHDYVSPYTTNGSVLWSENQWFIW